MQTSASKGVSDISVSINTSTFPSCLAQMRTIPVGKLGGNAYIMTLEEYTSKTYSNDVIWDHLQDRLTKCLQSSAIDNQIYHLFYGGELVKNNKTVTFKVSGIMLPTVPGLQQCGEIVYYDFKHNQDERWTFVYTIMTGSGDIEDRAICDVTSNGITLHEYRPFRLPGIIADQNPELNEMIWQRVL